MNKCIVTLLAISLTLLVGCSSSVQGKNYYQLSTSLNKSSEQKTNLANRFILIEPVEVQDYLNKNGIVFQNDAIKYTTANNNLWISPLSKQLETRITQDLSLLLPEYLVSTKPITAPFMKVKLFIDGFHGSYTGDAIIKGRWVITKNNDEIYTKAFQRIIPLKDDGYSSLVNALSKGWQEEEIDFINNL